MQAERWGVADGQRQGGGMSRKNGGFGRTNKAVSRWIFLLVLYFLVLPWQACAAGSKPPKAPEWVTESGYRSMDGYAELAWAADPGGAMGLFRLDESSARENRSSYVEGDSVRIYRSVPGKYRFTLRACSRNASGVPACGKKSKKLTLFVNAVEAETLPAASSPAATSLRASSAADSVSGGPDQMRPGLWFNPERSGHGYSFYWANRLALPESHSLHGFNYDLHGIWYTYEAKNVFAEPGSAGLYSNFQPLAARMKLVRDGDNSYSGGIYVTRNGRETLEGSASVTFGADNTSALVEWSVDFKLQRLSGRDPITLLAGTDGSGLSNISHYAGTWNSTGDASYQLVTDVGSVSEAVEILFEDAAGDMTWVQAVNSGEPVSAYTNLCFYYVRSGYAPGSQGSIAFDDLACDMASPATATNLNGARYFTGFERMKLWASITLPDQRGGVRIGSATSPGTQQKTANFHRVYFSGVANPCDLAGGACRVALTWFTDGDYPRASVFRRELETGQRVLVAEAEGPVVVDREITVDQAGTYVFELRMGNTSDSSLMAESTQLLVSESGLATPEMLAVQPVGDTGLEFQVRWDHPEPAAVAWYELEETVPGLQVPRRHLLSPGQNTQKSFSYPDGPFGVYSYRVRACDTSHCSGWAGPLNWLIEKPDSGFEPAHHPWASLSENAGSLVRNIRFHYAMGYHFRPEIDGYVTELGGLFDGSKTVKLFDRASGQVLAEASVSAANDWQYTAIPAVAVKSGREYTVAVYLAGTGGSYHSIAGLPASTGSINILSSTYIATSANPDAVPVNMTLAAMYGQADIGFSAGAPPEPEPEPEPGPGPDPDPANPESAPEPVARPSFSIDAESVTTGATEGEFFVDAQGSANYRIPLLVVPGSGGLAPQMSLQYNSKGANDIAGVGWSIGGHSAISRCPQTREQDGIDGKRGVSLDGFDRFCLDGHRLMAVTGAYGADGTEYRTEIDDFTKVVSRGQAGKGPAWFEVWHGNGSVSHFGNSQDSRIEARVPGDSDSVMTWALNRQQDGAGNYIEYRYQEQAGVAVEVTLASVHYTGNTRAGTQPYAEMRFHYSTGRNDVPDLRVLGGTYTRKRLLSRVDSLVKGDASGGAMQSLRSWFLAYGQDGFGRKVLESVEECSDSGKAYCFEPTSFSWLKNENEIGRNGVGAGHLFPKLFKGLTLADVNGDGRKDLLILEGKNPFSFKIAYANADGSFQSGSDSYPVPAGAETDRPVQLLTVDMDADGYQDVIYPKKGSSGVNWVARLSDSHGYGKEIIVAEGCCDYLEPKVASVVDFNGDGLADLVTHTAVDITSWQGTLVVLLNGSGPGGRVGFEAARPLVVDYSADLFPEDVNGQWFLKDGAVGFSEVIERTPDAVQVFDYNGDGNVDLLARVDRRYIHCGLNCGTTAAARAMSIIPPTLDFESSPPSDDDEGYFNVGFYIIFESDGAGRYSQKAVVAKEAKFGCEVPVACDPWSGLPDVEQIFPVDINGDGLADLAYRDQQGEWFYRVNTGAGFETPEPVTRIQNPEISEYARFIDISGDGYPEFLYPGALDDGSATWKVHSNDLGNGFGAAEPTDIHFGHNTEGDTSILLDFNGDGMVDNLFIDFRSGLVRGASTLLYPGVNLLTGKSHQAANVISAITDGFGKKIQLRYGALTDPAVHTRLANATEADWGRGSAVFDLVAPVFVVSGISSSAPTANSSSSMSDTEYHYVGARLQAGGRGFLGFAEVIQWSPDSGIRSNTRYRQDFPYVGLPAEILQELSSPAHRTQSLSSLDPGGLHTWPQITSTTPSPGAALAGETIRYSASSWQHSETVQGQGAWSRSQVARIESAWSPRGELLKKTFVRNVNGEYGRLLKSVEQTWGGASSQPLLTMTSTSEFYPADLVRWNLNRVSGVVVQHQRSDVPVIERKSAFEYDPVSGRKSREITEPSSSEFRVVSAYQLDLFGNRVRTTVSANGVAARTSRIEFDSLGRFAVAEYNHYGQQVMRVHQWDPFGTPVKVSDIDGVVTSSATDPMGRVFGSWTETGSWDWKTLGRGPGQVCPAGTAFHHRTRFGGKPDVHGCFDLLQREVRAAKEGFDGRLVFTDTGFDSQGRVQRVSEPYFQGEVRYWNMTGYDQVGRILEVKSAGGDDLSMAYGASASAHCGVTSPHALETTNGLGQKQLEVRNALGEATAVYDNNCGKVTYLYDAIGNLLEVTGIDGSRTRMSYDLAGRKISTSDPDKGYWQYRWNGLGELLRQLDAKGQAMDYQYDGMGRVTRRRELSGVDSISDSRYTIEHQELTWWQNATTAGVHGKGQPTKISYQDGAGGLVHQQEFAYDKLGRVSVVASEMGGMRFSEETTYDQFARKFQQFDASGDYRGIRYRYNAYGYLDQMSESREGKDGTVYRDIGAMDARGNVVFARLGNGVEVFARHHADSGQLQSLEAYDSAGRELQDVEYLFDVLGNLQQRLDRSDGRDLTEDFSYDSLNRLARVELTAPANFITTPRETLALEYDAAGNISWKSDVGQYLYGGGGAGPHAVSFAAGQAYSYDANGNQLSGDGRTLSYSVFDKAVRIERNGQFTEFSYGIAHRRIKRVDGNTADGQNTTHYIGNVEYVEGENGTHFKRHLAGVAVARFYPSSAQSETLYVVKDHLGSPHNLTGEEGRIEDAAWMHFGAYGQRRGSTWDGPLGLSATGDLNRLSNRGFTGHEQIDAMGLIHMNGRVYDPKLGRFLQADPLVQAAGDGQALNRYSYALNNPLSYTDPSGYSLKRFVKRWGRLIAALVVSVILPGGQGILATTFGLGNVYAQAAITGFIAGAITSGTFKGAVIGALTAVAIAGIVQANSGAKPVDGLAELDQLMPEKCTAQHLYGSNEHSEGLYRIFVNDNGVFRSHELMGVDDITSSDVIFTNGIRNGFEKAVRNATVHIHQAGLLSESYILNFNPTQGIFADLLEASQDIIGAHTGWTHSGLAKNLAGVLDQASRNGVGGIQLVGHSQGGAITASALRYAGKTGLNLSSLSGGGVALHGAPVNAWMARNRLGGETVTRIISRHQFGDAVHVLGGLNMTSPLEVPIALLRVPALFSADTSLNPHSMPCAGSTSFVCSY